SKPPARAAGSEADESAAVEKPSIAERAVAERAVGEKKVRRKPSPVVADADTPPCEDPHAGAGPLHARRGPASGRDHAATDHPLGAPEPRRAPGGARASREGLHLRRLGQPPDAQTTNRARYIGDAASGRP